MKNLERLIGLGCRPRRWSLWRRWRFRGAGTTASTGGGGGGTPSTDDGTPRAEDPMAPAPAPKASSFDGRQYSCEGDECQVGKFEGPFAEPTIRYSDSTTGDMMRVVTTDDKCLEDADGDLRCKPAAGSIALLPDNRLLYSTPWKAPRTWSSPSSPNSASWR